MDRYAKWLALTSGAGSVIAGTLAVAALAGWWFDSSVLMRGLVRGVAMNPATALAFLGAGTALWLVRAEPVSAVARRGAATLAALVVAVAVVRLAGYALGADGGPDAWLAGSRSDPATPGVPNRMAPNTAMGFLLLGGSLLTLDGSRHRLGTGAALGAMLLAVLSVAGYAFGGEALYAVPGYIPMAFNTALALLALTLGVLASRPRRFPVVVLLEAGPGSTVARRVWPVAIVAVAGAGWLMAAGLRARWFNVSLGVALLVTFALVGVTVGLWRAARSLNRFDTERRRFFELSRDLLAVADFSGHFKEVNPEWERTLGWTREELTSRPFAEFVHPDDLTATVEEYDHANAGNPVKRFVNRYRTRDGRYRWLEWSATTVPAQQVAYAVARDVTELRRLERELQDRVTELSGLNEELEAFSYSVSHDLRAPLRHVAGFADLLDKRAGADLDDEARRYLATIRRSARHMSDLIDDLLDFSRIGRAALATAPVDLTALVRGVWEELRPTVNGRLVEARIGALPPVQGDTALLRVAFANLLSNALKYTGPRPRAEIVVEGRVETTEAVVSVRDNGVGFDMQYADKLFGVFQRLHAGDQFEGTGIGLATVRRVVQRHGGRVWAESEPDRGATFHVALPLAGEEA